MFCERCGCIMKEGEFTCPECGAYYGPVPEETEKVSYWYLVASLLASAAAAALASYYIGFYAVLFLILFGFGNRRPRTKAEMILKGVSLGLLAGCVIGLALRYLL